MTIEEYRKKRSFNKTPEPEPSKNKKNGSLFVIQKHKARSLHYDFRLEHNGVLKSWAVPKGLPSGSEKRLAVMTEDHPLDYADFEGIIPEGQYGAGKVIIWDRGKYENIGEKGMGDSLDKGHLKIRLEGSKIKGTYSMIRTKEKNWLIIKKADEWKEIDFSNRDKILFPAKGYTKTDLVDYYKDISELMLPHIISRPISMYRFPNGANGHKFFQKNIPQYSPSWIKKAKIRGTYYAVVDNKESLIYLSTQVAELHINLSKVNSKPDRMIFDLDPENGGMKNVSQCAKTLKDVIEDLNLKSFVMTTGSKGLHIVVPIEPTLKPEKVRAFATTIAQYVEQNNPEKFTTEFSKLKREAKVFIDSYRNSPLATAIAPYSVRALPSAPVAAPLEWDEVKPSLNPQEIDMKKILQRADKKGDLWEEINLYKQSLSKAAK